jgi:predicted nucleic acid-binding protein
LIVYLDSSAVVPILVREASTQTCRRVWEDADGCVTAQLTYVEVAAALAMAERRGRLDVVAHDAARAALDTLWQDLDAVELTHELAQSAAGLARTHALRGFDAVQCASAAALADPSLVAAAGDAQLLGAWRQLGIAVLDTNQPW